MTHPERERLLAHVDGELQRAEANAIAGHIAGCVTCARVIADLRGTSRLFSMTLVAVDRMEPAGWGGAAAAVDVVALPPRTHRRPGEWSGGALRRAALFLLVTGAAASAAVLIDRVVLTEPDGVDVPVQPDAPPALAAVAVIPVNGAVEIALADVGSGTRVQVMLEDRTDARVIVEGAVSPHFTAADGRIDVQLADAAVMVRVLMPRQITHARVSVEGETVVSIEGGRVTPAVALEEGVLIGSRPDE